MRPEYALERAPRSFRIRIVPAHALHWTAEQVQPVFVDAAQVPAAQRNAVTIEEFENLDCDLAAVVHPITELRGGEFSVRQGAAEINDDFNHLRNGRAQKEMVVRDLVDAAHAPKQLEQAPHLGFRQGLDCSDVANARGAEPFGAADERPNSAPMFFILRRQAHFMPSQSDPGAIQGNLLAARQTL